MGCFWVGGPLGWWLLAVVACVRAGLALLADCGVAEVRLVGCFLA